MESGSGGVSFSDHLMSTSNRPVRKLQVGGSQEQVVHHSYDLPLLWQAYRPKCVKLAIVLYGGVTEEPYLYIQTSD